MQTEKNSDLSTNSTFDFASTCGRNTCTNTKLRASSSKPSLNSVYSFIIALCVLCAFAIVVTIFLMDNISLTAHKDNTLKKNKRSLANFGECKLCFKRKKIQNLN